MDGGTHFPDRPPPEFAVTYPAVFQYDYARSKITIRITEEKTQLLKHKTHLQKAKHILRLSGISAHDGGFPDSGRELGTFAKGTMLHSGGEKRGGGYFLPEVESAQMNRRILNFIERE